MWWHGSFSHNAHIPYQSDSLSPGVPIPNSLLANASGKGRRWHPSLGLCHQCVRLSWNFWLLALSWPRSGCYRHLGNEPVHGRLKESSLSLSLSFHVFTILKNLYTESCLIVSQLRSLINACSMLAYVIWLIYFQVFQKAKFFHRKLVTYFYIDRHNLSHS